MIRSVDAVEDIVHVAFSLGFLIRSTKAANRRTVPRGGSAAVQDDIGLDDIGCRGSSPFGNAMSRL